MNTNDTNHSQPSNPNPELTSDVTSTANPKSSAATDRHPARAGSTSIRFWGKTLLQPVLAVAMLIGALIVLGLAQRAGLFESADPEDNAAVTAAEDVMYVCPMACVPPSREPGKCPVCGMDLQPQKQSGDTKDKYGLRVDPASIRIANIQTAVAKAEPLERTIRAFGEIGYDESSLATIAAYVDGRIEELFADYTGVEVHAGDALAILYSPELYSGQVALLEAAKLMRESGTNDTRIVDSNKRLYESSRQRLIELGLTDAQVDAIEESGKADSRIRITSPISGTVIEKLAVEGQYVKAGEPIYRVADLKTVWLQLEVFPSDAAHIRFGQKVITRIQSLPGREFEGRVNFIDPVVDAKSQTVRVRVVVRNPEGQIRIGDYASAEIRTVINATGGSRAPIYDPELAGKWISPRHPEIVSDQPGPCPKCGIDLVPAAEFGFASTPQLQQYEVVIPRSALLMAGHDSVVYVETEPGRFEFRPVTVGHLVGGNATIVDGLSPGERVVAKAAILIDSQFNMAGKPSLIDPSRYEPQGIEDEQHVLSIPPEMQAKIDEAMASLTPEDRVRAIEQQFCPVADQPLGSMGPPIKISTTVGDIFICCAGCEGNLQKDPEKYLVKIQEWKRTGGTSAADSTKPDGALPKIQALPPALPQIQPLTTDPPKSSGGVPSSVPDPDARNIPESEPSPTIRPLPQFQAPTETREEDQR